MSENKTFETFIYAKSNITGKIEIFEGPRIQAISRTIAEYYVKEHFQYCFLGDEIVDEILLNEKEMLDILTSKELINKKQNLN